MSLLFYQEIDYCNYEELVNLEKEKLGELKVIRFYKNKREDRLITKEEEELLIAWSLGKRTEEDIK